MAGRLHVKVDGVFHSAIAPWGDLEISSDEHGSKEATWGFFVQRGDRRPALTRGAVVAVMLGSHRLWYGTLGAPDWRGGTVTAYGLAHEAEGYQCLDGSGNHTATPSVAVDRAIAAGWQVTRGSGIPTTAYTATTEGGNTVGGLLDANADELGQRWFVGPDGVVNMATDPTTPTWHIGPNVVDLGLADQDYASTVAVRYLDSGTSTYKTALRTDVAAEARFGHRESEVNATVLGAITTARANGIGDAILVKGKARLGWANQIEVIAGQLTNAGGVPADPALVQARQMVRIRVPFDDIAYLGGHTYLDAVIGSTSHADGAGALTLAPIGTASQSLADVIEETLLIAQGRKRAA